MILALLVNIPKFFETEVVSNEVEDVSDLGVLQNMTTYTIDVTDMR